MKLTVTFETDDEVAMFIKSWRAINTPRPSGLAASLREWQSCDLASYQWTARTENLLRAAGFLSFDDLSRQSDSTLLKIPNFGRLSLKEVRTAVADWASKTTTREQS